MHYGISVFYRIVDKYKNSNYINHPATSSNKKIKQD